MVTSLHAYFLSWHFSCALFVALAACSNTSAVIGGNPDVPSTDVSDDLAPLDVAPDLVTDVAPDLAPPPDVANDTTPDVATDTGAPDTGPPRCTNAMDCRSDPSRGACDVASGRCVQCVAAMDTCPATEHCNALTNMCEPGCRSDEGCMGGSGDAGAGRRGRCDTMRNTCVECLVNDDCAPGNHGCETDTRSDLRHCGSCDTACATRANAMTTCEGGRCGFTCNPGFADCNGNAMDGCEVDTRTSAAHCGACGRACSFANAAGLCRAGTCSMGACNAGFSDCDYNPANGCETRGACVYTSCNAIPRAAPTGVYTLSAGGTNWNAYCDMTSDGGGWTLVMKVPGRDGRFLYTSAIWTDTSVLNEASTDLSTTPAKFRGFSTLPFTQLRLGMLDGAPRFIVVPVSTTPLNSIREVFAGPRRATTAGRATWMRLVASPSLQRNCNAEGFNIDQNPYGAVRLGILGNQENDCFTPDSRIGFGGQYNLCAPGGDVSSGNIASCDPDNGYRDTALFGFIFVR